MIVTPDVKEFPEKTRARELLNQRTKARSVGIVRSNYIVLSI